MRFQIPDVLSVHDLHVWHLSQSYVHSPLRTALPILLQLKLPNELTPGMVSFMLHMVSHLTTIPHHTVSLGTASLHHSTTNTIRVILASLHVCVPTGTSLEQWEQIEQTLQHCFQAYGISHVTISPELQRSEAQSLNELVVPIGGCNRLSSQDNFGCAVSELKKRKPIGGV